MNYKISDLYSYLKTSLSEFYDDNNETQIVSRRIISMLTGFTTSQILTNPDKNVEISQNLQSIVERICCNEPLEYIFNSAQFLDLELHTEKSVLIPRPETEELVLKILAELNTRNTKSKLLDIGTGSGCIPVYLATKFQNCDYFACDISQDAITTATKNARKYNCKIDFFYCDILNYQNNTTLNNLDKFDIIVSNPPYVLNSEKKEMKKNVLDYEPHTALFVSDEDPLVFYRKIAEFASKKLNKGGKLCFEINERFATETLELLREYGFVENKIFKDLFDKDRMSVAVKP